MLNAEQRLSAFEHHLRYRNRRASANLNRFSNMELIRQANEFLNLTSWPPGSDTPEDLVARLRARRAKKAGATRSTRLKTMKKRAAESAIAAQQGELF